MTTSEKQVFKHDGEYGYDEVIVNPISSEYIKPSGTIDITENGTYDVTDKASANVNLPISFVDTTYRASTNILIANMNYFCQSYVSPVTNNELVVSFASTGQNEKRAIDVILIGKWK